MKLHPRAPTIFLAHTCSLALLAIFAMALGLAWSHLPEIEGYAAPVVIGTVAAEPAPKRTHGRACFSLAMRKVRSADPIVYQYAVEARQNEHWLAPLPIVGHIANDDDTPGPDDYVTHPVGTTWTRRWCAELPSTVADSQPIRITGYVIHRAHPGWLVDTPLPSVRIDGIEKP